jgi:hypothetical protein
MVEPKGTCMEIVIDRGSEKEGEGVRGSEME